MESQQLAQERQQLLTLLEQYRGTATDLPNLKAEASPGWVRQVQEWLQEVMRLFHEWFKDFLGPLATAERQVDWPLVSQMLVWLCVAVVVFWLTIALAKKYLRHKGAPGSTGRLPTGNAAEPLQHSLDAAVNAANWGLATRLRWRLFLSRMRCQSHVTPAEFFREPSYQSHWEQFRGASVSEQYRMMFAATDGSRRWYEHYHEGLTRLEGASRHV